MQVFVNGYRRYFPGIQMLSEETEPEQADVKLDNPTLPEGLTVSIWTRERVITSCGHSPSVLALLLLLIVCGCFIVHALCGARV